MRQFWLVHALITDHFLYNTHVLVHASSKVEEHMVIDLRSVSKQISVRSDALNVSRSPTLFSLCL